MIFKRKKTESEPNPYGGMLLTRYPATSRLAESYRTLRTNVEFSFMDRPLSSILITSAGQEEGKTTTVANFSYAMADTGKKVLMIDADLRKPVLSRIKPSVDSPGLSGLLSTVLATPIHEGELSRFSVSDLYRLLQFRRATGKLHLEGADEKVILSFLQGELIDVNWVTRPDGRKLASTLVKNSLITEDQAGRAMYRKKTSGQKLGFILINMGLVTEEDLGGFVILHMLEGLRTALHMATGKFSFKKLSDAVLQRPSFSPASLDELYKKAVIGSEEFLFIQEHIESAIVATDVENLYLLPSGTRPPKPSELMGSARMSFLLDYLQRRFDLLVIDTPPVLPASDALLLAPQVDGVMLVVKAGQLNRELVKKAVEQIRVTRANIIGVALNQVDFKREGYYQYYAKYYGGRKKTVKV